MTRARRSALAAAAALVALGGGGCSPPDEIVVAVPTDLSLPDDLDTLQIQVFEGGRPRFSAAYERLGEDDAGTLLPATIGFYSATGGDDPLRIQVTGRTGGELGAVRILREAATRIPKNRIVLLAMPLNFLCDGSGRDDGEGGVENARCGEGQTCVAGACASSEVDSSALPDYSVRDVYGGGTGDGDGDCFDVPACFQDAAPAEVDAAACTVAAPGGATLNVALALPSEDGICGDGRCLVALDAGSDDGFRADGEQIQLPPAVCEQMAGGKIEGVVTAPVTAACAQKTAGLPTCGPWSASGSKAR
ncbi:hypothetical protein SOCE26_032710 [Sorangium cellulosum]|uniref:Secreted protein n=1 Tax=Sorangium cellulosum TaxID=56 RepID=A0A2L0ERC3_SORCE|nr:hypothetical protein [Sorangium cellulosum]AUX41846.1 hypothetical protein SOCE26_032710 [Sorangium cellulosum]